MDKKIVTSAVPSVPLPSVSDKTQRALDLLIAKNGVFRTEEKWVHSALKSLIDEGYVKRSGSVLSIGNNFERMLLDWASVNPAVVSTVRSYRSMITSKVNQYNVTDFSVMQKVSEIKDTDEKIVYLTSVIADTFGKLQTALERTAHLENLLKEMDISLSVMESITFDEDSNC